MKNKFGLLKTRFLKKLTESYENGDKNELKNLLNLIKENSEFKKMYLFYEDIENKYIEDKEIAKLYVDELSELLKSELKNINEFCNTLNKKLGAVQIEENFVYETLDQLVEDDNLENIDKKLIAKKKLYEHLTTKKESNDNKVDTVIQNENLLHAILTNNFNVVYNNSLSEEQKKQLRDILSMSEEDVLAKTQDLKETVTSKVDSLLKESTDNDFTNKLHKVKDEVVTMNSTKYNYFKLLELKNGLD